tara:strand:- start:60 stop:860 length:801 start_codon:yes stop_codon:yes gene_type:complete
VLSQREIDAYHNEGWVVPQGFRLNKHERELLASSVDRVLADNPNILPDRMINTHLDRGAPYGIRGRKEIYDVAHDDRVLDLVEEVLGPDIILLFTHLFCKPASSDRAVPWHQDGPFWPVTPMASCTVWIAIDKVDKNNGAMRVIPCSHLNDYYDHRLVDNPKSTLNREIDPSKIDESRAVTIELEPGQASLHDIGIIHGSAANSSARRRAGLALRYIPATSCMFRKMPDAAADWSEMPMEVVRGVNRNERNNFSLGNFGQAWLPSV